MDDVFLPKVSFSPTVAKSPNKKFSLYFVVVPTLVVSLALGNIGGTSSYFADTERASANILSASAIDVVASVDGAEFNLLVTTDAPGQSVTPLIIPEPTSAAVQYTLKVEMTSGSQVFCEALSVSADAPPFTYNGPLLSLSTASTTITGPWPMLVYVGGDASGVLNGDVCAVDLVYDAWGADVVSGGYDDEERVTLQFTASVPEPIIEPSVLGASSFVAEPLGDETQEELVEEKKEVVEEATEDVAEEVETISSETVEETTGEENSTDTKVPLNDGKDVVLPAEEGDEVFTITTASGTETEAETAPNQPQETVSEIPPVIIEEIPLPAESPSTNEGES